MQGRLSCFRRGTAITSHGESHRRFGEKKKWFVRDWYDVVRRNLIPLYHIKRYTMEFFLCTLDSCAADLSAPVAATQLGKIIS